MAGRLPKPSRARASVERPSPSASRKSVNTGPVGASIPAAADATTSFERAYNSSTPSSPGVTPSSALRSASPMASLSTPVTEAISSAASSPTAVSMRGVSGSDVIETTCASVAGSALASTIPAAPAEAATSSASRSGWLLTLTQVSAGPGRKSLRVRRASILRDGATASSRSTMRASAPRSAALASISGRSAGTYRYERALMSGPLARRSTGRSRPSPGAGRSAASSRAS